MCNTDDKVILKWLVDHKVLSIALEGTYMCNTDDKVILKWLVDHKVLSIALEGSICVIQMIRLF